ncbi:hypothetical protein SPRG_10403 [Saprolegnia parasitica CBS 223.65]|uniref:Calcyclin-binding protein n=1 Tax=Saprolegnia parasitica (strain CBS 223.65) TaxID=695850 RepID=A0A067C1D5_SAPPC|nr:hypothetical protein SPRG_10403 [Saprolegnia parasitica CBS 223.65]KDO24328.1 hypothetical protein SPRG_10403 [Saprolegnia parasitica CBS 223.65]|eukprot:XP_012204925.1 hypothetical protein SPRG_10403 [Saprolegnia parasitica CBS 223.65]
MLTNDIMDDIQELQSLLATVKSPRLATDLTALLRAKEMALAKTQAQVPVATPAPTPTVYAPPRVADTEVYTEVSTFGWEDEGYGKPKVMVYITSGIDGVGELPASQVTCDFTKHSFDLKIKQLRGKNYRLVRYHLDKEIDPKNPSFSSRRTALRSRCGRPTRRTRGQTSRPRTRGRPARPRPTRRTPRPVSWT